MLTTYLQVRYLQEKKAIKTWKSFPRKLALNLLQRLNLECSLSLVENGKTLLKYLEIKHLRNDINILKLRD